MLERGEILDLLFSDGECLVMTGTRCMHLTAIPTEVLVHLEVPRTGAALRSHLEETFGEAPVGAFEALVEELIRHGLVSHSEAVVRKP